MRTVTAHIQSAAPYSASRMHDTPKLPKESPDAHEQRTWKNRAHLDETGTAFIPGHAFKMALDSVIPRLNIKGPTGGKSTFTKNFVSGVMCVEKLSLGVKPEDFLSTTINANADGKRGSGTRVKRTFPTFMQWGGPLAFLVLDDAIPDSVFETALKECGLFVGVGQNRPQSGGWMGRFSVSKFDWKTN